LKRSGFVADVFRFNQTFSAIRWLRLTESTTNSAYAVDKGNEIGSIEVGKKADLVIWNVQSYKEIPYHFGVNLVEQVIKDGKVFPLPLRERVRERG
jgi:predicted amidohydrolase YtcJ